MDWADRSTWEPALATIPDLRAVYIVMPAIVEARATAAEFLDLVLTRFTGKKRRSHTGAVHAHIVYVIPEA